jgi:flavin reductase (DIM6/NTAB) family NADH-FMN oxidoreductase RutF
MLAYLPLPVVIVTAEADSEQACATATLSYVSLEPPRVATPLRAGSRTRRLAETSGAFTVSVLADTQAELAVHPVASPPGAVATYRCTLESADGPLLVGRIDDADTTDDAAPLLRFRRRYHALGARIDVAHEADYPL